MSQSIFYDVVVVGAGVEGSSTAMWLARKGVKTLLLDQFELGHTRGSSHGGSKIIRYNLTKDVDTEMMKTAYTMWAGIEKEAGVKLVEKCGGIAFGNHDHSVLINPNNNLAQPKLLKYCQFTFWSMTITVTMYLRRLLQRSQLKQLN